MIIKNMKRSKWNKGALVNIFWTRFFKKLVSEAVKKAPCKKRRINDFLIVKDPSFVLKLTQTLNSGCVDSGLIF